MMVRKTRVVRRTTGGRMVTGEKANKSTQEVLSGSNLDQNSENTEQSSTTTQNIEEPSKKRYRVSDSSEFICRALYNDEEYSDIAICMLGQTRKLHKRIISQSPYFANLITRSDSEKEPSGKLLIGVSITDSNITQDALSMAISSLYFSEINIDSNQLVEILAAAKFLNLNGLIDKCTEMMTENISLETAIRYYNISVVYGIPVLETSAKRWIAANLLTKASNKRDFLKQISVDLMESLMLSADLIPRESEMIIYSMLKNWLYARMQSNNQNDVSLTSFFEAKSFSRTAFLNTNEGKQYTPPFQALRIRHMLLNFDFSISDIIRKDKIIPEDWISVAMEDNWRILGAISKNKEKGPLQLSEAVFEKECYRVCFEFDKDDAEGDWYIPIFLYGVNLSFVLNRNESTVSVIRDTQHDGRCVVASQSHFNFAIKTSLKWISPKGSIEKEKSSEIQYLSLKLGEKKKVLAAEGKMSYPVYLIVKVLVHSPLSK